MNQEVNSKSRTSLIIVLGSVLIGAGVFILIALLVQWSRPSRNPVEEVTAALTVFLAPTYTPTQVLIEVEETLEPEIPEGSSEGVLSVGAYVKVSGTGGVGLRLRNQPGLDAESPFLGVEDEIFIIEDGPKEADGFVWWYLTAPFEADRTGWAAANYLEIVQQP